MKSKFSKPSILLLTLSSFAFTSSLVLPPKYETGQIRERFKSAIVEKSPHDFEGVWKIIKDSSFKPISKTTMGEVSEEFNPNGLPINDNKIRQWAIVQSGDPEKLSVTTDYFNIVDHPFYSYEFTFEVRMGNLQIIHHCRLPTESEMICDIDYEVDRLTVILRNLVLIKSDAKTG